MAGFNISTQKISDDVVCVSLSGFLGSVVSPQLEAAVQEHCNQGIYKFVVDLSELKYISTRGIVVFLKALELVRRHDGDIALFKPSAEVKEVFDVLFGLSELIKIVPDQASALKSLGEERE